MRRSAVSIPSNIGEGKGRSTRKEFVQFFYYARGSVLELQAQISIARDLDYLDTWSFETLESQANEVGRLINGLISALKAKP